MFLFNSARSSAYSSELKARSRESPPARTMLASVSASRAVTFCSIFSNAASALVVSMPEIISEICFVVRALAARAFNVSFFERASASFFSNSCTLPRRLSMAFAWAVSWTCSPSATFWKLFFLISASLANPSSPRRRASSAFCCHLSAVLLAERYWFSSCLRPARARALAERIFDKSVCMSSTAWSMIFSGSSNISINALA
mmetsp:Transcript_20482/g.28601  ORF Transcript_20482/g.28601 Transcript_20482/m.28601 type:complete len:201 (-) Transcript_20482:814-1416(-)